MSNSGFFFFFVNVIFFSFSNFSHENLLLHSLVTCKLHELAYLNRSHCDSDRLEVLYTQVWGHVKDQWGQIIVKAWFVWFLRYVFGTCI